MSNQDETKNDNKKLDATDEHINNESSEETEPYEENLNSKKENTSKNNDDDQDVEIIYKKERNPIVKFLLGFLIFVITAYVLLFATGFIMGWMGMRPPSLDNNVIVNQWEKATGQTDDETEPPSEVQKKSPDNKETENAEQS